MSNKLVPVVIKQDGDGHWYILPVDKVPRFNELLEEGYESDNYDDLITEFSKYMTGGDVNLVQLYANIDE